MRVETTLRRKGFQMFDRWERHSQPGKKRACRRLTRRLDEKLKRKELRDYLIAVIDEAIYLAELEQKELLFWIENEVDYDEYDWELPEKEVPEFDDDDYFNCQCQECNRIYIWE